MVIAVRDQEFTAMLPTLPWVWVGGEALMGNDYLELVFYKVASAIIAEAKSIPWARSMLKVEFYCAAWNAVKKAGFVQTGLQLAVALDAL